MNTMNKVIAIGKAILSKKMIKDFKFKCEFRIREIVELINFMLFTQVLTNTIQVITFVGFNLLYSKWK